MCVGGFDMFVMDLHFTKMSIAQLTHTSFFEVGGSNIHAPTYTKKVMSCTWVMEVCGFSEIYMLFNSY